MTRLQEATKYRLAEIRDIAASGVGERTGKAAWIHDAGGGEGERGRRVGGVNLEHWYPELKGLDYGPKMIADAIRRGKYRRFRRIERAVQSELRKTIKEPRKQKPVIPPHKGNRKCKLCQHAHGKGEHRFHGPGSFHTTHAFAFNPRLVKIYGRVMKIYLGRQGWYDLAPGAVMYGLSDGSLFITWKGTKRLPRRGEYSRIYGAVSRVEAQKTQAHRCDPGCKAVQHKYYHPFGAGAVLYGLSNKNLVIRSK